MHETVSKEQMNDIEKSDHSNMGYRIYSINRPGRLLNFWTLRVGASVEVGAY